MLFGTHGKTVKKIRKVSDAIEPYSGHGGQLGQAKTANLRPCYYALEGSTLQTARM